MMSSNDLTLEQIIDELHKRYLNDRQVKFKLPRSIKSLIKHKVRTLLEKYSETLGATTAKKLESLFLELADKCLSVQDLQKILQNIQDFFKWVHEKKIFEDRMQEEFILGIQNTIQQYVRWIMEQWENEYLQNIWYLQTTRNLLSEIATQYNIVIKNFGAIEKFYNKTIERGSHLAEKCEDIISTLDYSGLTTEERIDVAANLQATQGKILETQSELQRGAGICASIQEFAVEDQNATNQYGSLANKALQQLEMPISTDQHALALDVEGSSHAITADNNVLLFKKQQIISLQSRQKELMQCIKDINEEYKKIEAELTLLSVHGIKKDELDLFYQQQEEYRKRLDELTLQHEHHMAELKAIQRTIKSCNIYLNTPIKGDDTNESLHEAISAVRIRSNEAEKLREAILPQDKIQDVKDQITQKMQLIIEHLEFLDGAIYNLNKDRKKLEISDEDVSADIEEVDKKIKNISDLKNALKEKRQIIQELAAEYQAFMEARQKCGALNKAATEEMCVCETKLQEAFKELELLDSKYKNIISTLASGKDERSVDGTAEKQANATSKEATISSTPLMLSGALEGPRGEYNTSPPALLQPGDSKKKEGNNFKL